MHPRTCPLLHGLLLPEQEGHQACTLLLSNEAQATLKEVLPCAQGHEAHGATHVLQDRTGQGQVLSTAGASTSQQHMAAVP